MIQEKVEEIDLDNMDIEYNLEKIDEQEWLQIEADTYWCLCLILNQILDNYTQSQPGIVQGLSIMKQVCQKVDPTLFSHFNKLEIDFYQFAFRWLFCLLLREFPLQLGIRLFDTYISEYKGFEQLHPYVCVVTLFKFSSKLKLMGFNEIIIFLQKIPTHSWTSKDMQMLIQQAYVYKSHFFNSNHII